MSCQAGEAISSLGQCSFPHQGGRAHGRGRSGQLEKQQERGGLLPSLSSLSSFEVSRERWWRGTVLLENRAQKQELMILICLLSAGPHVALEHTQGTQSLGPLQAALLQGRELRPGIRGPGSPGPQGVAARAGICTSVGLGLKPTLGVEEGSFPKVGQGAVGF